MYQPEVGHELNWEVLGIAGFGRNRTVTSLREIVWREEGNWERWCHQSPEKLAFRKAAWSH